MITDKLRSRRSSDEIFERDSFGFAVTSFQFRERFVRIQESFEKVKFGAVGFHEVAQNIRRHDLHGELSSSYFGEPGEVLPHFDFLEHQINRGVIRANPLPWLPGEPIQFDGSLFHIESEAAVSEPDGKEVYESVSQ